MAHSFVVHLYEGKEVVGMDTQTRTDITITTRAPIYKSLRAQNPNKVSKSVFWKVCTKFPKYLRKSEEKHQQGLDFLVYFLTFSGIFGDSFADPHKDSS